MVWVHIAFLGEHLLLMHSHISYNSHFLSHFQMVWNECHSLTHRDQFWHFLVCPSSALGKVGLCLELMSGFELALEPELQREKWVRNSLELTFLFKLLQSHSLGGFVHRFSTFILGYIHSASLWYVNTSFVSKELMYSKMQDLIWCKKLKSENLWLDVT